MAAHKTLDSFTTNFFKVGQNTSFIETRPLSLAGESIKAVTLTLEIGEIYEGATNGVDTFKGFVNLRASLIGALSTTNYFLVNNPPTVRREQALISGTAYIGSDIKAFSTVTFIFYQMTLENIDLTATSYRKFTPSNYGQSLPNQSASSVQSTIRLYNNTFGEPLNTIAKGGIINPHTIITNVGLIPNDIRFQIEPLTNDYITVGNTQILSYSVGVLV